MVMLRRSHMPSQAGRRSGRFVTQAGLRPPMSYSFTALSRHRSGITGSGIAAIGLGFLMLAGCSGNVSPPAVELRVQRVEIPVPQPCLAADLIPAEPEKVAPRLTGDAAHDLDLVAASALRLRAWGQGMRAALVACAK